MSKSTTGVAKTLFKNRSESHIYRVTLDDERAFEVTTVNSKYEPAGIHGSGNFRQDIEYSELPAPDVDENRYPTLQGEIQTVETDDGWGTPVLHVAVQYVKDNELVDWEYPVLGTVATIQEVDE